MLLHPMVITNIAQRERRGTLKFEISRVCGAWLKCKLLEHMHANANVWVYRWVCLIVFLRIYIEMHQLCKRTAGVQLSAAWNTCDPTSFNHAICTRTLRIQS